MVETWEMMSASGSSLLPALEPVPRRSNTAATTKRLPPNPLTTLRTALDPHNDPDDVEDLEDIYQADDGLDVVEA